MKTVLIVDDSAMMRGMIRSALNNHGGYQVIGEANNGQVGVEKFKELNPNIVTMDGTMDVMNGFDALRLIIKHNPEAKVVMVSSMGQEIMVKEAILAGAKGFIVKPFEEARLIEALEKL